MPLADAVGEAKAYLTEALRRAYPMATVTGPYTTSTAGGERRTERK